MIATAIALTSAPAVRARLAVFAALSLALVACAPQGLDSSGHGAPAPLVYATPGTRIALLSTVDGETTRTEITVGLPAGARGSFTRGDGSTGWLYPGCWGCGGDVTIDEAAYRGLWPLETGKRVQFDRADPDGQMHRISIRVAGTERIETAAGSFDTYLLDGRIETVSGPRFAAHVRAWWAPDPGWVVRAEGGDSKGSVLTSEAVSISRP